MYDIQTLKQNLTTVVFTLQKQRIIQYSIVDVDRKPTAVGQQSTLVILQLMVKFWPCSQCFQTSWGGREAVQSHEMRPLILIDHCQVMHYAQACFPCGHCSLRSVSVHASLHAQPTCPAPVREHSFADVVFAYIYIRLFVIVHRRHLCGSVAPFTNTDIQAASTYSCCVLLFLLDSSFRL